eukprot:359155-Chlamydomonas_euryale.AAC.13
MATAAATSPSLSATLVKVYKKFLIKLQPAAHYQHAGGHKDTAAVESSLHAAGLDYTFMPSSSELATLKADISVERAFGRIYAALVQSDAQSLWVAGKQHAKARLARALGPPEPEREQPGLRGGVSPDLPSSSGGAGALLDGRQTRGATATAVSATHGDDIEALCGSDGLLRVRAAIAKDVGPLGPPRHCRHGRHQCIEFRPPPSTHTHSPCLPSPNPPCRWGRLRVYAAWHAARSIHWHGGAARSPRSAKCGKGAIVWLWAAFGFAWGSKPQGTAMGSTSLTTECGGMLHAAECSRGVAVITCKVLTCSTMVSGCRALTCSKAGVKG